MAFVVVAVVAVVVEVMGWDFVAETYLLVVLALVAVEELDRESDCWPN